MVGQCIGDEVGQVPASGHLPGERGGIDAEDLVLRLERVEASSDELDRFAVAIWRSDGEGEPADAVQ